MDLDNLTSTQKAWIITTLVVLGILVLALLAKVSSGTSRKLPKQTLSSAEKLLKASSKWAFTAEQDKNPLMALMHISYALAYSNALREILTDLEIQQATGVDIREHVDSMETRQRHIVTKLGDKCPKVRPEGGFAVTSGWLG